MDERRWHPLPLVGLLIVFGVSACNVLALVK